MALDTVEEYVDAARTLLLDNIVPYRYTDAHLLDALNFAFLEARRLRPDLFLGRFDAIPEFATVDTTAVVLDEQFRLAFVYFMVGHAQLKDDEDVTDSRAATFITQFMAKLAA